MMENLDLTGTYMQKERVNLLVTIDRKYLKPLANMLDSYKNMHQDVETHVYIAHSALEEQDIDFLNKCLKCRDISIHSIKITEKWFSDTPVLERLPEESFYRLMAFQYLPAEVERCLYLDPDIYIRKSLLALYKMDLEDSYIAAASHLHGIHNSLNKVRLGLQYQKRYVNSGVMLMDLKKIRNTFTVSQVLECLSINIERLYLGDQDLINILFDGKIKELDECIYNLDEHTYKHYRREKGLGFIEKETVIIHYNGKYKPWLHGYRGVLDCFYPYKDDKGPAPKGKWLEQIKAIAEIFGSSMKLKIVLMTIVFLLVLTLGCYLYFGEELAAVVKEPLLFREWIEKFGMFGAVVFVLIRALQTIVKLIPAEPLELASGYIWGAWGGMACCLLGNLIGTIIIIKLTQRFGHKFIDRFVSVKYQHVIYSIRDSKHVYWLLFILYLLPGIPKDGFTYFVGLLQIKLIPFLIVTGIARIPSILSSTVCGTLFAETMYWQSIVVFIGITLLSVICSAVFYVYSGKKKRIILEH